MASRCGNGWWGPDVLDRSDYHIVRDLARELTAQMETLCCGCRDADGRTLTDERRLRGAAETTLAKIAALVMTKQNEQD